MKKVLIMLAGVLLVPTLLCGNDIYAEEKSAPADNKQETAHKNISQKPEIFVQLGHSWNANSIALSPDGKYLITESKRDKNLKLWNVESGREIRTFYHSEDISPLSGDVSFSPDGNYVLSLPDYHTVKIWDIRTGKELRTFKDDKVMFTSAYFSPNGKSVLTKGGDAKEWDIETGEETYIPGLTFYGYSPNGKDILAIRFFKKIILGKSQNGKQEIVNIDNSDNIGTVKFSPDGRYILAEILNSKDFKLWDSATGKEARRFTNLSDNGKNVIFSPNGKYLLSIDTDHTVKLWNVNTGENIRVFKGHSDKVNGVAFSPDGKYILTGSKDKTIKLWEVQTGKELKTFITEEVHFVTFTPNGKYALSNGLGGTQLWDITTGRELRRFEGSQAYIYSVAFTPDGKYALSGGFPKNVIWNLESGNLMTAKNSLRSWRRDELAWCEAPANHIMEG